MTNTPPDHSSTYSWWTWPLAEPTPYLLKRMVDRQFSETDLREMLTAATLIETDTEPDRWRVHARFRDRNWHVIIEPQAEDMVLVVVTAYPLDE